MDILTDTFQNIGAAKPFIPTTGAASGKICVKKTSPSTVNGTVYNAFRTDTGDDLAMLNGDIVQPSNATIHA